MSLRSCQKTYCICRVQRADPSNKRLDHNSQRSNLLSFRYCLADSIELCNANLGAPIGLKSKSIENNCSPICTAFSLLVVAAFAHKNLASLAKFWLYPPLLLQTFFIVLYLISLRVNTYNYVLYSNK